MSFFQNKKGILSSSLFASSITHGFGTKLFGDGRKPYSFEPWIKKGHVVIKPQQVHSTNITFVSEAISAKPLQTDGLITNLKGIMLSVITADCVPIIFYDPKQQIIGISHQGWKGTLGKLPLKMIQNMQELGVSTQDIQVAIGPCINDCCYEVSTDLADQFVNKFGDSVVTSKEGKAYLNLLITNYDMLLSAGISSKQIDYGPFCTSCQKDLFWSYRRDKGIQGEMVSFVML